MLVGRDLETCDFPTMFDIEQEMLQCLSRLDKQPLTIYEHERENKNILQWTHDRLLNNLGSHASAMETTVLLQDALQKMTWMLNHWMASWLELNSVISDPVHLKELLTKHELTLELPTETLVIVWTSCGIVTAPFRIQCSVYDINICHLWLLGGKHSEWWEAWFVTVVWIRLEARISIFF